MNSHFKYKLHIVDPNIDLLYDDVNTVGSRIREVREVRVLTKDSQFIMMFDERFNELDFIYNDQPNNPFNYVNTSTEYLKQKFNELKSTDFRYKSGDGYEGSKILYLEDFITYLKSENRELTINKILK
jgi:hypothetical protein